MTRPQRSTTTGPTSTGELPPDARGRTYTGGDRPDDRTAVLPETPARTAVRAGTGATAGGAGGASARRGGSTSPGTISSRGSTSAPDAARLSQPVISRAGEMPDSVRASVGLPLAGTASPAAGASAAARPGGVAAADRGVDYRSNGRPEHRGAGALVSDVANNLSKLVRQEIELAKAEMRQSATRAGKGAGMFGGAAVAGVFALLFLLLAVMFALGEVMALGWAALIVGAILLVCAGILALVGRANVKKVSPKPTQTVETLKEDMQWAHGLRK